MNNGILKLDWISVENAVIMAVAGALLALVTTAGFSLFNVDLITVGKNMLDLAFVAGITSLCRDLLSTNSGSFLGLTRSN